MADLDGAADAAAEGTDAPSAKSDQDTVSRKELEKAVAARNRVKADRDQMALEVEGLRKQVEDLAASDSNKALELANGKIEKLEKALADVSGQLDAAVRGRTTDKMFHHVAKAASADEEVLRLAWDGLLAQGALDDVLEDGDADAALKALKKKAPSLFTQQKPAKSGVLLPDGPTSFDPMAAAREAEEVIAKTQGRRVKNLMAGS